MAELITNEQKKVFNMLSSLIWYYFSDYIKIVSSSKSSKFKDVIEEDLLSKGFLRSETELVSQVFAKNLTGLNVANVIPMELSYKLISYMIKTEFPNCNDKELIDILHRYNIDFISEEGAKIRNTCKLLNFT